jgi:SAM-dependent methyltransferase
MPHARAETALLNRPMLPADLEAVRRSPWAKALRDLVREYRAQALPVMNGGFAYSNLVEGPGQMLTCNPYRLWEYASLFEVLEDGPPRRFVDVGGAASPLSFLLAERGHPGLAVDLQPLLVQLCDHVAAVRGLPLEAATGDITRDFADRAGEFDLATLVSVLEHVPAHARPPLFAALRRLLRPGGLLYLTFDYGGYVERSASYRRRHDEPEAVSESVSDLDSLCRVLEEAGFRFVGDDPRALPAEVRARTASPDWRRVTRRYTLNTRAFDDSTPWSDLARYVVRRVARLPRVRASRFAEHNFFRMYLEAV